MSLKNPLLKRFWFYTSPMTGYGVTAYSLEDAQALLDKTYPSHLLQEIQGVIEDVDVSNLGKNHVLKNMGPTNIRGIWYPRLNLSHVGNAE